MGASRHPHRSQSCAPCSTRVVDVVTETGVETPELVMVSGGVAALVYGSMILSIFSSNPAKKRYNVVVGK